MIETNSPICTPPPREACRMVVETMQSDSSVVSWMSSDCDALSSESDACVLG